jgi:hypothetical protein
VTPQKDLVWKYVNPEKTGNPFSFGGPPKTGDIMPTFLRDMIKMTNEQRKELDVIQKEVDAKLDKLLSAEQKKQLKEMPAFFFGPPGGPGGPGGPPPGGPGGASVFRAYRYAPEYPGLAKKDLKPGKTIEESQDTPKALKQE